MIETLKETIVFGVHTNIPFLMEILKHPEFVEGQMTTQFIEKYFPRGLTPKMPDEKLYEVIEALRPTLATAPAGIGASTDASLPNPWLVGGRS